MNRSSAQIVTQVTTAPTGAFTTALTYDRSRFVLLIQNKGEDSIFIHFGDDVATEDNSLEVGPGDVYEPFVVPTNAIQISTISTATAPSDLLILTDSVTSIVRT